MQKKSYFIVYLLYCKIFWLLLLKLGNVKSCHMGKISSVV